MIVTRDWEACTTFDFVYIYRTIHMCLALHSGIEQSFLTWHGVVGQLRWTHCTGAESYTHC